MPAVNYTHLTPYANINSYMKQAQLIYLTYIYIHEHKYDIYMLGRMCQDTIINMITSSTQTHTYISQAFMKLSRLLRDFINRSKYRLIRWAA